MPLYEFECTGCHEIFEKLCDNSENLNDVRCPACDHNVKKLISQFAHSVAGGSSTEPIDISVGRAAEKRWQKHEDRKAFREKHRAGKDYKEMPVLGPKTSDGKHMPVMALGDNKEKAKRKEYSEALQEHRTERIKKGQGQFDGPGAF